MLIAAAERYMLAVKRLGEESGYNCLTYFEAPILKMPTEEMREDAHERWLDLNISGQQLGAAVNAAKLTLNEPQGTPDRISEVVRGALKTFFTRINRSYAWASSDDEKLVALITTSLTRPQSK